MGKGKITPLAPAPFRHSVWVMKVNWALGEESVHIISQGENQAPTIEVLAMSTYSLPGLVDRAIRELEKYNQSYR